MHGISWSPNGKSLALLTTAGLFLRHSDGRVVTLSPSQFRGSTLAWSPDGRWIAVHDLWGQYDVSLVRIGGGTTVIKRGAIGLAWSPDSRLLALEASNGLNVRDIHSGRIRLLTRDTAYQERPSFPNAHSLGLAWPPDGRSVAYIPGGAIQSGSSGAIRSGDLRTVTLTGHVRTLVSADRSFGGRIVSVAWTQPPSTVHYQPTRSAPRDRVTNSELLADGQIEFLAADGGRVAYSTECDTISLWRPTSAAVMLVRGVAQPDGPKTCGWYVGYRVSGLTLAGNGVAWVETCCNNYKEWHVKQQSLDTPPSTFELGGGHGDADIAGPALGGGSHFDSPAGAGSLLVFSSWQSARNSATSRYDVIWQSILRSSPNGCPCPTLRTDPGPLIIDDVEGGHIAAHGNNGIVVLDSDGTELSFIPVKPSAAALSGGALIVLLQGELREYDWANGSLVHSRPLPSVAAGPDCPFGIKFGCPGESRAEVPLRLQDAAHGLVAYVLDDQVHLLRLTDGKDVTIAAGSHARFIDTGLVDADGSRLHLVPFDKLPLR